MTPTDPSSQIVIIIDEVRAGSTDHLGMFSGWQWESLRGRLLRAGISPDRVRIDLFNENTHYNNASVIVGLGEKVLRHFTQKRGIDKWQLSPLVISEGQYFIPTYDLGRIQKQPELGLYQELAFRRAIEVLEPTWITPPERFILNPSLEESLAILSDIAERPEVAVDVETGYGQINTVGFAWSASDAIAINVLPDRFSDHSYFELWRAISGVLTSPSRKILQNHIYDLSYFSAYGIRTEGEIFDTMWAMKFLWPELKSNLGNVGRIYTKRPYWKDDGKVTDEEGKKKDWGNVRDWTKHYIYNCRDTTGTFEAKGAQLSDLRVRKLDGLFTSYLMRLSEPIREMCAVGMPLSLETREALRIEVESKIKTLTADFHSATGGELNPRSSPQVMKYLKAKNVKIPKKYDKASGGYKESVDSSAIKKIRLKHPELRELAALQDIKSLGKALSSYIDFVVRPDGRLPYSLNGAGTETLRWSGGKDPWDRGFNIQTIPREGGDVSIKQMFVAPEGWTFVETDLRQAESRFVAYDSADKTLIDMLESGADVHTHVGRAIVLQMGKDPDAIPKDEFKSTWRQLGKKAGHGLNYFMKPGVFVETVFNELDMVITRKDAEAITAAYYGLFPGIPRWHAWVRRELNLKRKLTAPSGWERYFYGRFGDDMFKEAYAWRPQHTIPWVTNHMMLHLMDERKAGRLKFRLIYQGHDALISLVPEGREAQYAKACHQLMAWHPEVTLSGGRMIIPVETKAGRCMARLEEIE